MLRNSGEEPNTENHMDSYDEAWVYIILHVGCARPLHINNAYTSQSASYSGSRGGHGYLLNRSFNPMMMKTNVRYCTC